MKTRTHSALARDYKGVPKLSGGYGGWRCPCCNPFGTEPRKMKARARRIWRHVSRRQWMQEVREEE